MIRYTGQAQGVLGLEKLVGLGISRNDMNRLLRGERLVFRMEQHGLGAGQMVIFFGETELQMTQQLEKLFGPSTQVELNSKPIQTG